MDQLPWLLLSYQVPVTPSKKRVYVWRKLKEMGAVYYKQGVAMLPKSAVNLMQFQTLLDKIIDMQGEASLAEMRYISMRDEQKAIAAFREQSVKEYQKIIREIIGLEKGPLSRLEKEEKAKKLGRRLSQIKARDYFMSRQEPEILKNIDGLLRDMSSVTTQLSNHLSGLLHDR